MNFKSIFLRSLVKRTPFKNTVQPSAQFLKFVGDPISSKRLNSQDEKRDCRASLPANKSKFDFSQTALLSSVYYTGMFTNIVVKDTPAALLIATLLSWTLWDLHRAKFYREISWKEFSTKYLAEGKVEKLEVHNRRRARVKLVKGAQTDGKKSMWFSIGSVDSFERNLQSAQKSLAIPASDRITLLYKTSCDFTSPLGFLVYLAVLVGIGGGIFELEEEFKKSKANEIQPEKSVAPPAEEDSDTSVSLNKELFNSIIGHDKAKEKLQELIYFVENPEECANFGVQHPGHAILHGSSGVGKSTLGLALKGLTKVPVIVLTGPLIQARKKELPLSGMIQTIFDAARNRAPCIVFIDDIDAIIKKMGKDAQGAKIEALNELIFQMQVAKDSGVVLIATTSSDKDKLEPSVLERFEHQLAVYYPDKKERFEIFQLHLGPLKTQEGEDDKEKLARRLAIITPGFSGAEIRTVCNLAALNALRDEEHQAVTWSHLEKAVDSITSLTKPHPEERRGTAFHEAGHVVVAWFSEHLQDVESVTILPSGGSLGYTELATSDRNKCKREYILQDMCVDLGGYVAELLFTETTASGVETDLRRATKSAYDKVMRFGMSNSFGPICIEYLREEGLPLSEESKELLDREVRALIEAAYKRTHELLTKHEADVRKVAEQLLEKNTLLQEELIELLGERPFKSKPSVD